LKPAEIKALSKAFDNFDRIVAMGWLVADAVGLPLLERADAYVAGGKVRRAADTINKQIASDKKAAQRLALKDESKRDALLERASRDAVVLLRGPVNIGLDKAAPTSHAPPRPSGKRKVRKERKAAQSVSSSMLDAEIEIADREWKLAERAVLRAEAAHDIVAAEKAEDAKLRVVKRFLAQFDREDVVGEGRKSKQAQFARHRKLVSLLQQAQRAWHTTQLSSLRAECVAWEAKVVAKDALVAECFLRMEQTEELIDALDEQLAEKFDL